MLKLESQLPSLQSMTTQQQGKGQDPRSFDAGRAATCTPVMAPSAGSHGHGSNGGWKGRRQYDERLGPS